jgi:hypothetical protein
MIAPFATASIPSHKTITATPLHELESPSLPRQSIDILDPHPFFTEFYVHEFASERSMQSGRQHSAWFSPVTSAASLLSKRVANLRHALVRMMP